MTRRPVAWIVFAQLCGTSLWFSANGAADDLRRLWGLSTDDLGWLTEQQLLDAVAIGQVTPGPVFTTATFVGYIAGGFPGAVVATLAIFIPAFLFVGLLRPVLPRLQAIPWVRPLLDGVNIAAIGLMVAVSVLLTADAVVDVMTAVIAVVAFVLLVRFRVNSAVLIVAGAVVGGLSTLI